MKLYRYRTIESALLEPDNGTLYFAAPDELNDPIEGYVKIFWRGDVPAWEGLLKNFVCSLFYQKCVVKSPVLAVRKKEAISSFPFDFLIQSPAKGGEVFALYFENLLMPVATTSRPTFENHGAFQRRL